ncbi:MAG TPA: carbohydrate ABC transporter permease [Streptosporangiales bacterium]
MSTALRPAGARAADRRPTRGPAGRHNRFRVRRILLYAALTTIVVVTLTPLVYAASTSLKPLSDALAHPAELIPHPWTWHNYHEAWIRGGFYSYTLNTFLVTAGLVLLDLVASSMLGYVLARKHLPGQRAVEAVLTGTLFVGITTAMLYPQYDLARRAGMANQLGMVFVEYVGIAVIHTYLIKAFVQGLPTEVEESARLDGCGLLRIWWHVALPLMRPILGTTVVLAFQASWNNYQVPLAFSLNAPSLRTLTVGVSALQYDAAQGISSTNIVLAGSLIAVVPIIVVFLFLQRNFVRGWTEGAIK